MRFARLASGYQKRCFLLGGKKNHGHGQSSISKPKLLQRFYSVRSQFQIKSIETSNNATFLLTHGGQVYYFGEMITDGSMPDVMHHPQHPKLMKELSQHKIIDIKVSCPGYFHGRHYRLDHISIAALTDQNIFSMGIKFFTAVDVE